MQQPPIPGPEDSPPPPPGIDNQISPTLPSLLTMKVDVPLDVKNQELKLPQALEQALAFKSERAKELGVSGEENGLQHILTSAIVFLKILFILKIFKFNFRR